MNLLEHSSACGLFHGVVGVDERDGGLSPERMTSRQLSYFRRHGPWSVRARCNAGVTLELVTDSPYVELRGRIEAAARSYLGIDLEVDGALRQSLRWESAPNPFHGRFVVGTGRSARQRLAIHLCNTAAVRISHVEIAPGSTWEPVHPGGARLLCLGDSITQGMGAVGPASTLAVGLARLLDAELHNLGVGGHVFDPAAVLDLGELAPTLVTVAYGSNDWAAGTTREQIRATVRGYLARLREQLAPGVPVVLVTPVWRSDADEQRPGGDLQAFGAAVAAAAADHCTLVVDGYGVMPHDTVYFADGLHPDEIGFMHYASNLFRAMRAARLTDG